MDDGRVKAEVDIGAMWPDAKECLELPEARRGDEQILS